MNGTKAVSSLAVFDTNAEHLRTLTICTALTSVRVLNPVVAAGSLSLTVRFGKCPKGRSKPLSQRVISEK